VVRQLPPRRASRTTLFTTKSTKGHEGGDTTFASGGEAACNDLQRIQPTWRLNPHQRRG